MFGRHLAVADSWQRDPLLSRFLIKQMVTDAAGFRWLATTEGVYRYDGYEAVPLQKLVAPGSSAVPHEVTTALLLDPQGRLWVGAEGGLFCFTPRTGQFRQVPIPAETPSSNPNVVALFRHPRTGHLWVGHSAQTVVVLDLARGAQLIGPPRLIGSAPLWFQADTTSAGVWITTMQPMTPMRVLLAHVSMPRVVQLPLTGAPTQQIITPYCMVPVPGTHPLQLFSASARYEYTAGRWREVARWLPPGREDNLLPLMTPADTVREWVSQGHYIRLTVRGPRAGHVRLDSLRMESTPNTYRHAYLLQQDPLGMQWCYSRYWRGCYKRHAAAKRVVEPLPVAGGRPAPSARGIVRLPDGRLLLGLYGGPWVQAADSPRAPLRRLAVTNGGQPYIPLGYDLLVTRTGRTVVAEEHFGFSRLDPRTGDLQPLPFAANDPHPPTRSQAVLEDHHRQVWGATDSGLFQLDFQRRQTRRYRPPAPAPPLPPFSTFDLAEDANTGALWLATSRGLYYLQPATGTLRRIGEATNRAQRPLPGDAINCVVSAGPGRAWVGTGADGLLLVDATTGLVRQLGMAEGMPSPVVATVLVRPGGVVWVGTYAGLVRYDPTRQRLAVYAEAEGLTDPELNRNSAYADPATGALLFGGVGGVFRVQPDQLATGPSRAPTQLLLTAVAVPDPSGDDDGTELVSQLTGYQLPALHLGAGSDDFVELRLALTDYLTPDLTHYAYRLRRPGNGPLSPWLPTTRRLVLRGLAAGDYEVEARAETATGQLAANVVRVPLHVARHWWQHPLAWVLGAMGMVLLGYAIFWLQGRPARRDARLREELAANLHDEVGALLTRINFQAQLLRTQQVHPRTTDAPEATDEGFGRLLANTAAAVQTMRDVVWSIDARADSAGALLDRMQDFLDQTTGAAGLEYTFEADQLARLQPLRPVVRKQLYLVFKEAVTNVLRHAKGATTVDVRLLREGRGFALTITDDGQAPLLTGQSGLGLRNMRARARALGGTLETGPRPDGQSGFRVRLQV